VEVASDDSGDLKVFVTEKILLDNGAAVYEWTENGQNKLSGIYVSPTKAFQCGEQLLWEYMNYEFQRNPRRKK
jgi:hypothetical protein